MTTAPLRQVWLGSVTTGAPVTAGWIRLFSAAILVILAWAPSAASQSLKRMPDGKEWTTANLAVATPSSYCYGDDASNCDRYGRLYTWEAARKACPSLGTGWLLPTDEDWRRLAKGFGGIHDDASDRGRAAFDALLTGGSAGFNAVLGGGRSETGEYGRIDAHGFYWTATEDGAGTAVYYNFGKGSHGLYRQTAGEKPRAFAVRCIRQ